MSRYIWLRRIIFILIITGSYATFAAKTSSLTSTDFSHRRDPNKSFREYVKAAKKAHRKANPHIRGSSHQTALDHAVPLNELDTMRLVSWENEHQVNQAFQYLRDIRFLNDPQHENFVRRSSWLYPDDGCFARAELARANIENFAQKTVNKVFAFGDLTVATNNTPEGSVTWWYHVAPMVKVGNANFVLDPAISPETPLRLEEWLARMTPTESQEPLTVAVCDGETYVPNSKCRGAENAYERALEEQEKYLDLEWQRQLEMGRRPELVLGSYPPWVEDIFRVLVEATGIEPATF